MIIVIETFDTYSLGSKISYFLNYFEEYMKLWLIKLGYGSEKSIKSCQKVYNPIIERYQSQIGALLST